MKLALLGISIITLVYGIMDSYSWWFEGRANLLLRRRERNEIRKPFCFMPQVVLFGFYDRRPGMEIWLNRAFGLFIVIGSNPGIVVTRRGPF